MKKIAFILVLIGFCPASFAQDCANCFDDGPAGCGKQGYFDGDNDGWAPIGAPLRCFFGTNPSNYATKTGDCDDTNDQIFPRLFFTDNDDDGYGQFGPAPLICQAATPVPDGKANNSDDCDDTNAQYNIERNWYADSDNDSYGDPSSVVFGCAPPAGMVNPVQNGSDYDDSTNLITNVPPSTFYFDGDNDDYGISSNTKFQSFRPAGYALAGGDCDDTNDQLNPETIWYLDTDGDGLGVSTPLNKVQCTSPGSNYVLNNSDACPDTYGTAANNGCAILDAILAGSTDRNWVWSINYDPNGTIKGNGIGYFDDQGKPTQDQSIDIGTGQIWAGQTLYDSQGRPALQTLSAPIGSNTTFDYKTNFAQNTSGAPLGKTDFELTPENPPAVGTASNSLGWYYSSQNTDSFYEGNSYKDVTNRPYSRITYSELNPGTALKNFGGNKVDTDRDGDIDANDSWAQSYVFTMPASKELSQNVAFGNPDYDTYHVNKTVSRDPHGVENVLFVDTDGKTLATARSGGTNFRTMEIAIEAQGYVDIHVPTGNDMGFVVNPGTNTTTVHDLISETTVSASRSMPNGFYRVSVANPDTYTPGTATVSYRENYYDYSLNQYDEIGRLTASYQPLGSSIGQKPKTTYEYNTLGQLMHIKTPDEGEAWFKYRNDGQIRYSQNSKQRFEASPVEFSYTNYDAYGRPLESGVVQNSNFDTIDPNDNATSAPSGARREQQVTTYDEPLITAGCNTALCNSVTIAGGQTHVNGNVAITQNSNAKTYYSYDQYGRVKWLIQEINGLGVKTIDYSYDPITGLMTEVTFQKNLASERFTHRYSYDEKNQLILVETTTDGSNYNTQANYSYYETGELRRTELANGAQGVDYVYNLAGQLKSINHPSLSSATDPGGDSNDFFGMQLDYHKNDYSRTGNSMVSQNYGADLFNGNIKGTRWKNQMVPQEAIYAYEYDRNNWLKSADFGADGIQEAPLPDPLILVDEVIIDGNQGLYENPVGITVLPTSHFEFGSDVHIRIGGSGQPTPGGEYDVSNLTYDANGNIKSLRRNKNDADAGTGMDDLTYRYNTDHTQDGPNQLRQVEDSFDQVSGADDIGTQGPNNYEYNQIGQLTKNVSEGISYFYNAAGLVTEVQKNDKAVVKFYYNDRNRRVKKERFLSDGVTVQETTYYLRDAAGLATAIYIQPSSGTGVVEEYPIYGNGRIGVYYKNGVSQYELTDHLGNVRVVFSNATAPASYTDYFPFGSPMPNRIAQGDYRYAVQGQEKDGETGKEAFELRLWDGRIGRWLTTDPYGQYSSPYLGMGNDPVNGIDPDGGWKTKWGRFWAWVDNGFKGQFTNNPNASDPDDKYGITQSSSENGGVTFTTYFDDDGLILNNLDRWDREIIAAGRVDFSEGNFRNQLVNARKQDWFGAWAEAGQENIGTVYKAAAEYGLLGSGLGYGPSNIGRAYQITNLQNKVNVFSSAYKPIAATKAGITNLEVYKYLQKIARGKWIKVYEAAEINGIKNEVHYFKHVKKGIVFDSKIKKAGEWSKQFTKGANKVTQ